MYSDWFGRRPPVPYVYIHCGIAEDGRVRSIPLRERYGGLPSISSVDLSELCIRHWETFAVGLNAQVPARNISDDWRVVAGRLIDKGETKIKQAAHHKHIKQVWAGLTLQLLMRAANLYAICCPRIIIKAQSQARSVHRKYISHSWMLIAARLVVLAREIMFRFYPQVLCDAVGGVPALLM